MTTVNDIEAHIKKAKRIIKDYRAKAKELNAMADKLAQSNSKLIRQLGKVKK